MIAVLAMIVLGQGVVASGVVAATSATLPGPILPSPSDIKPPVPRPLPSDFHFSAVGLPEGFIEVKNIQSTSFSFGPNAPATREAPGFSRVWTRPVNATKFDLIVAVVETSDRSNPAMNPSSLRGARVETQMRPGGVRVYVATPRQSWDVRWTERGLDVRLIVEAPTVTADDISRLVAGIKLT